MGAVWALRRLLMHESGLARSIVAALRDRAGWTHVRVLIADPSHAHSAEALLLHLEVEGSDLDLTDVEVVMLPVPAVCTCCGEKVDVLVPEEGCARCGGSVIAVASSPTVVVELSVPDAPAGCERPGAERFRPRRSGDSQAISTPSPD